MNQTKSTNKTDRLDIRCEPKIKNKAKRKASEQGITASIYICNLIENDEESMSHEQQIEHSLTENHLINSLLASDELPIKYKKLIGKEIKKYV